MQPHIGRQQKSLNTSVADLSAQNCYTKHGGTAKREESNCDVKSCNFLTKSTTNNQNKNTDNI